MAMDDVPELCEMLNGIFKREIEKWQANNNMGPQEVNLSLNMYNKLMAAYIQFRILKRDIMAEVKAGIPMQKEYVESKLKNLLLDPNYNVKSN
jgi:hypothetical protein